MPQQNTTRRTEISIYAQFNWWRIIGIIAGFVLLASVIALGAWILRWQGAALDQIGPERMRQLSREANDRWYGLEAQRSAIFVQRTALAQYEINYGADRRVWPQGKADEYIQLKGVVDGLTTTYLHQCGQYKAMWGDAWRDLPAPDDLPRACPPL